MTGNILIETKLPENMVLWREKMVFNSIYLIQNCIKQFNTHNGVHMGHSGVPILFLISSDTVKPKFLAVPVQNASVLFDLICAILEKT